MTTAGGNHKTVWGLVSNPRDRVRRFDEPAGGYATFARALTAALRGT